MIISRAPVRISFFGGGTDYPEYFLKHGGAVLATAIDKYSYITASQFHSPMFDYSIRIQYRKVESVKSVNDIEHNVFRECLKFCGIDSGIELHTIADLPAFTGLGSSSSFTVSLLHALHAYKGEFVNSHKLAQEAIYVERHLLNDIVGCQDQVTAAFGGFNLVEFRSEEDIQVHRIPLSPTRTTEFEQHLFVVFTGLKRKAADIVVNQLRHVSDNASTLSQMRLMVDEGWNILTGNRTLFDFGQLLDHAWKLKRNLDTSITNDEIDSLYRTGMEAGAWGGKLLGAGGGGFLLFFAPPEKHHHLALSFPHHQIIRLRINAPGSQIIFS
ncbi:MAG: GHMP kinase [Chloroflexi bacterium]|nr:GHMP kinase [Chloroflexota bacterium]MCL5274167.1 GHMP kinase [Chloroflexota bacterium]